MHLEKQMHRCCLMYGKCPSTYLRTPVSLVVLCSYWPTHAVSNNGHSLCGRRRAVDELLDPRQVKPLDAKAAPTANEVPTHEQTPQQSHSQTTNNRSRMICADNNDEGDQGRCTHRLTTTAEESRWRRRFRTTTWRREVPTVHPKGEKACTNTSHTTDRQTQAHAYIHTVVHHDTDVCGYDPTKASPWPSAVRRHMTCSVPANAHIWGIPSVTHRGQRLHLWYSASHQEVATNQQQARKRRSAAAGTRQATRSVNEPGCCVGWLAAAADVRFIAYSFAGNALQGRTNEPLAVWLSWKSPPSPSHHPTLSVDRQGSPFHRRLRWPPAKKMRAAHIPIHTTTHTHRQQVQVTIHRRRAGRWGISGSTCCWRET